MKELRLVWCGHSHCVSAPKDAFHVYNTLHRSSTALSHGANVHTSPLPHPGQIQDTP